MYIVTGEILLTLTPFLRTVNKRWELHGVITQVPGQPPGKENLLLLIIPGIEVLLAIDFVINYLSCANHLLLIVTYI